MTLPDIFIGTYIGTRDTLYGMRTNGTWGSIRKRIRNGTVRYIASYPNPLIKQGPRIESSPFKTEREAANWLKGEEALVRDHRSGVRTWTTPKERKEAQQIRNEKRLTSMEDYVIRYLQDYRKQDGSVPAEAYKRKLNEYATHLSRTEIWRKPIASITPEDIQKWLNHSDIDPTPRLRAWQMLKAVMQKAVDEGLVDKNPVQGHAPKVPPSRQATIPPASPMELSCIADNMPESEKIAIWLGATTDLRIGEICALQVGDIDLHAKMLHVRHSVGRGEGDRGARRLKAPKTMSSARDIPIPPRLAELLAEQMRGRKPEDMLIPAARAEDGILRDQTLRRHFDQAKRKANRPDLHFHSLRAGAITAMVEAGATLRETMELGGHSDVSTSVQRYQRTTQARKREIIANVESANMRPRRTRQQIQAEIRQTKRLLQQLEKELSECEAISTEVDGPRSRL